ncbi:MAG: DUF2116 family Zn-ribbon domain-containing protein [Bacteroidota bacterium]
MEKRHCPVCGDTIQGRRDKRFCTDQCRAVFNNDKKRESEGYILEINRILRKNRGILKAINPQGRSTVKMEYLKLQGFDFRYFTTYYRTKSGNVYFFCYEFGYLNIEDDKVLIINRQSYMDKFPNVLPKL